MRERKQIWGDFNSGYRKIGDTDSENWKYRQTTAEHNETASSLILEVLLDIRDAVTVQQADIFIANLSDKKLASRIKKLLRDKHIDLEQYLSIRVTEDHFCPSGTMIGSHD